jgi:hypothetical protein
MLLEGNVNSDCCNTANTITIEDAIGDVLQTETRGLGGLAGSVML